MELLYLWIENYRNIQHQGFNFSSKWKFDYQNEQLTVEERPNVIDHFFGKDIVNLTALIGSNGSGKTSVLEFIYNELFSNYNKNYQQLSYHNDSKNIVTYIPIINLPYAPYSFFFFIIQDENSDDSTIQQLSSIKINLSSFSNRETIEQDGSPRLQKPASILYSPFITQLNFKHSYYNLTTTKSVFRSDYYNNPAQMYFHYQTRDSIHFLDSNVYKENTFPFKVLDLQISLQFFVPTITYYEEQVSKLQQRLEASEFIRPQDLDFFNLIISSFVYKFKATHKETIYCLYLTSMIISAYESFSWRLSEMGINNYPISDRFNYNIPLNSHSDKTPNISIQEYTKILLTYLTELLSSEIESITTFFHDIIQKDTYIDTHPYLRITQKEALSIYEKEEEFYGLIKEKLALLNCHPSEIQSMPKFAFTRITMRGLSSGERHMLQLFERFYRLKSGLQKSPYLLILIDEGETSLHPQWQKQYIKQLTQTLPLIFKDIPIQIILTSHSPFIVSDLPKENIIFLDTDEQNNAKVVDGLKQKETFGANIHTLFSDAFFMDGGLMGDFAKEQINALIQFLNNEDSFITNNEQAQQYINLIGEPIIKRQLQKMLDSKRLTKVDENKKDINSMKEQLAFLEQQVAALKQQINPVNNDSHKS